LGGLKEVTGKGGRVSRIGFFLFRFVQFRFRKSGAKNNSSFSVQAFLFNCFVYIKVGAEKSKDV